MCGSPGSLEAGRLGTEPCLGQLPTYLWSQVARGKSRSSHPWLTASETTLWTSRLAAPMVAMRSEHRCATSCLTPVHGCTQLPLAFPGPGGRNLSTQHIIRFWGCCFRKLNTQLKNFLCSFLKPIFKLIRSDESLHIYSGQICRFCS